MPFGPRRIELTPQLSNLFDQSQTDAFYFVIWSRNGTPLQNSTNSPAEITLPDRANPRNIHTFLRRVVSVRGRNRFILAGLAVFVLTLGTFVSLTGLRPDQRPVVLVGEAMFPDFHAVYIDPESFAHYQKTGEFRDGTVMIKELVAVGAKEAPSGKG